MPTIEIIALESESLPDLPPFDNFAYIAETKLCSHRGIFQTDFDQASGIILHLGNNDLEGKEDSGWFAGDLIEWTDEEIIIPQTKENAGSEQWWGEDQVSTFRFAPDIFKEVRLLLEILLNSSPVKQLYFTTDYQYGPSEGAKRLNYSFNRFIEEHDRYGLRWNCLYQIRGNLKKV